VCGWSPDGTCFVEETRGREDIEMLKEAP
jgi:hypothetical protein